MPENIAGVIRHVLTVAAGYFVAKGKLDPTAVDSIIGVVMAVVGFVWSWKAKVA